MIVVSISAENVLKYASLELSGFPEEGIIAVSGQNESGKSSIGETICFALFGRTYSFGSDMPEKIICWGQRRCTVDLVFAVADGTQYQISRFLDNSGHHSARLCRVDDLENPIASGVQAVGDAMLQLLGYDYDEFIESFYLAQREITTPHRNSQAVKTMAGLTTFEMVTSDVQREITEEQAGIEEAEAEIAAINTRLEELDIEEGYFQGLEAEHKSLVQEQKETDQMVLALGMAATAYEENVPRLEAAYRGRRSIGILCLLLTLGLVLSSYFAINSEDKGFMWEQLCAFSALSLIVAVGGLLIMKNRIEGLSEAPVNLARKLMALQMGNATLSSSSADSEKAADSGGGSSKEKSEFTGIYAAIAEYAAEPDEARELVDQELYQLHEQSQIRRDKIERLSEAISKEQVRVIQANELIQSRETEQQKIAEHRHQIAVKTLAAELLIGAETTLSQRFNRDLRELVGHTLPLFTSGRYEHLKIDEELNVQVFSNQKRDFTALDEVSSGTQRQIMLAVRLALSQKLVDSAMTGRQFIFLDEPFAFFDAERTLSTLKVLPQLSDEITQIWLIAQDFPAGSQLDRHIECAREYVSLSPAAMTPDESSREDGSIQG